MAAISTANSGALAMPTQKCLAGVSCRIERNSVGEISRLRAHTNAPPKIPASMAIKVSNGRLISSASTRGNTSNSMGLRPRVRIASISSLAFIEPICAVKALAVRPARRMAVSSTPNSRRKENATSITV